jgi:hypothetical protein
MRYIACADNGDMFELRIQKALPVKDGGEVSDNFTVIAA